MYISIQVETLEWILDHGGSALDRDNLGGTPVHDAAEQGQVHVHTHILLPQLKMVIVNNAVRHNQLR